VWLAAHAAVLGLILSLKFLTAKTVALLLIVGAGLWFVMGRRKPLALPAPRGMV
jgi:hypothetical protein